ncbi:MAG: MBL fold metallo-hydrolase [Candidatus Micrarchaeota archaeon]
MKLDILGAGHEVGRSCFVVNTDKKIMLDCGLKIHNKEKPQLYPMPPAHGVDACVISHAHLDHIGFLPSLFDHYNPQVISTLPTKEIGELLLLDSAKIIIEEYGTLPYRRSSHKDAMEAFRTFGYGQKIPVGQTDITLNNAGHVPGSASVLLEHKEKRILYSGDFRLSDTQMHNRAHVEKDVDLLIVESTYANRDHPNRKDLEVQLAEMARETIENGGSLLLPAFAVGRTQELLSVLKSQAPDLPVWVDGMGVEASKIVSHYGAYIRDVKAFRKYLEQVNFVTGRRDRQKVLSQPSVIISTAGMLQGGPAMQYLLSLNKNSQCIFSGYCVEGTNGHNLLNYGYVEKEGERFVPGVPISYLDFSAHAGRTELFDYVKGVNPKKVVCVHGDEKIIDGFVEELKLEGFDASGPVAGDSIEA